MSFQNLLITGSAVSVLAASLCGCSAHQDSPATPVDSAKTPTFRSSANSTDQPNTPLYTQPGVNHGTPATVPSVKTTERYDQNAPLAVQVYGQIQQQLGTNAVRYITVQSKGGQVQLGGTAKSQDVITKVTAVAKSSKGVTGVINQITLEKQ